MEDHTSLTARGCYLRWRPRAAALLARSLNWRQLLGLQTGSTLGHCRKIQKDVLLMRSKLHWCGWCALVEILSNYGVDTSIQGVVFTDGEDENLLCWAMYWSYYVDEDNVGVRERSWYANVSPSHLGVF